MKKQYRTILGAGIAALTMATATSRGLAQSGTELTMTVDIPNISGKEEHKKPVPVATISGTAPTANGQTQTIGRLTFNDGTYVGEIKDGKAHGKGRWDWPFGVVYIGEWKDGKRNGQGTQTDFNGHSVAGEWKDDKYVGPATTNAPATNGPDKKQ